MMEEYSPEGGYSDEQLGKAVKNLPLEIQFNFINAAKTLRYMSREKLLETAQDLLLLAILRQEYLKDVMKRWL